MFIPKRIFVKKLSGVISTYRAAFSFKAGIRAESMFVLEEKCVPPQEGAGYSPPPRPNTEKQAK